MDTNWLEKLRKALLQLLKTRIAALDGSMGENDFNFNFEPPNKTFVDNLSANPTINCYLIAIYEDLERRRSEAQNGQRNFAKASAIARRQPRFVDVNYMLTIWNRNQDDSAEIEHQLLGTLLTVLGAYDFMPDTLLRQQGLDPEQLRIRMQVFGSSHADKVTGQIWQALGTTPKPTLMLSLSVPVIVHGEIEQPLIEDVRFSTHQLTAKARDK